MSEEKSQDDYALKAGARPMIPAPELPYLPPKPRAYSPKIGLIACGGITQSHLSAYQAQGYEVVALCDVDLTRAEKRRTEFYPEARITTDFNDILRDENIAVVDIASHPRERLPIIEAALRAKKHVLSQKPFVLSLDDGERLCDLADANGVRLAVNQNGRWAPHFAYIREAVHTGLIGDVIAAHVAIHWDHTWVQGTPFETIYDLVFYDFAIHWFDFLSTLIPGKAQQVFASRAHAAGQTIGPPMLTQALVQFDGGQASLIFDAHVKHGSLDTTFVAGTAGTLISTGPDLGTQTVTLVTEAGIATPALHGKWFNDGFKGTMGELLCAIEEGREPRNSARNNLASLALCFAAIGSANDNSPVAVGSVRHLPEGSVPLA